MNKKINIKNYIRKIKIKFDFIAIGLLFEGKNIQIFE